MKVNHPAATFLSILCTLICLTACEHNISTGTSVYEDGSLQRTIIFSDADSGKAARNIMGVSSERGWETYIEPAATPAEGKEARYHIAFTKDFGSVDEANKEISRGADTIFQIRSSLENTNGWFFTYMEYSDTYVSLDRFRAIPQADYFTKEDYAFIERLPAEGSRISKSDSLYLSRLNEKVFDFYGARTIFEEMFSDMLSAMHAHNVPAHWSDSLLQKKEIFYQQFFKEGNVEDADLLTMAQRMGIPLPSAAQEIIRTKTAEMERRLDFISEAYSGKYVHSITMPWRAVSSNADSVSSNTFYWNPPVIKFLLQDYTMTARARKMNVWQVGISVLLVMVTVGLFFFRRRKG